jgi:predicted CoA-binding protein
MAGINDPGEIARALKTARTIAVVGCSPKGNRPSHAIASYLLSAGFDVIPVNPGHTEILGRTCYPDLASIPKDVRLDIVDVFRRSEFVPEIVEAAIRKGATAVWMQEGVIHEQAARRAEAAGLTVIMDRCILKDHRRLG